jgi:uncharacterized protein (DUF4415 family)
MKKASKKRMQELERLARLPDYKIDLTDISEIKDWSKAVIGKFYRPLKKSLTIRLDADVLAWLRAAGPGYQTRINKLLRSAMENEPKRRRA